MGKLIAFDRYPHKYGKASCRELDGVLPQLVRVATLAIIICPYDGTIQPGGGLRTPEQAAANADNGTGIKDSRHIRQPDGFGHAIDIVPLVDTDGDGDVEVSWAQKWLPAFKEMAIAVKRASAILEVPIRQGCDWNMNGKMNEAGTKEWDWPHFEDPIAYWQKQAAAEMRRFRAELEAQGYDLRPERYLQAA